MSDNYLTTAYAEPDEVQGMFRLILFSGAFSQQLGRVAFLDCADDGVEFAPYVPDDEFRIVPYVSPQDALVQAEAFVSLHPDFLRSSLAKVLASDGTILGFEVRPLYAQPAFGTSDVLDIAYRRRDQRVIISIHLQSAVERQLSGN